MFGEHSQTTRYVVAFPVSRKKAADLGSGQAIWTLANCSENFVGHRVTDEELVHLVEEAARRIGVSPRQLDASLWEYQRGGPTLREIGERLE